MTRHRFPPHGPAQGPARNYCAVPVRAAGLGPDDCRGTGPARLRHGTALHGQVTVRMPVLVQGCAVTREGLRRLAALRFPRPPPAVMAARLSRRSTIVAGQARTMDRQLSEARRLPGRAARAASEGRARRAGDLRRDHTRQPGGCGQAEGE